MEPTEFAAKISVVHDSAITSSTEIAHLHKSLARFERQSGTNFLLMISQTAKDFAVRRCDRGRRSSFLSAFSRARRRRRWRRLGGGLCLAEAASGSDGSAAVAAAAAAAAAAKTQRQRAQLPSRRRLQHRDAAAGVYQQRPVAFGSDAYVHDDIAG